MLTDRSSARRTRPRRRSVVHLVDRAIALFRGFFAFVGTVPFNRLIATISGLSPQSIAKQAEVSAAATRLLVTQPMERQQIRGRAVIGVRRDQDAARAVGEAAIAIDPPAQTGIDRDHGVAQRVTLNEIVGQLVERTVEDVVDAGVALEHADQDLSVVARVAIEGEAAALADQDPVGLAQR